ncbi:hypothetical protein ACH0CG_09030 [Microbacterium sp. 179-I 1D1 NHS]|uniref:hypothetical protein n=1 Tax=Microbacterium sp. 179-I 1D1 NHS TaxID=3374298 RepID=UPI00387944BF
MPAASGSVLVGGSTGRVAGGATGVGVGLSLGVGVGLGVGLGDDALGDGDAIVGVGDGSGAQPASISAAIASAPALAVAARIVIRPTAASLGRRFSVSPDDADPWHPTITRPRASGLLPSR